MVVDARLHELHQLRDLQRESHCPDGRPGGRECGVHILVGELDVVVFDLRRPMRQEAVFDAHAQEAADGGVGGAAADRRSRRSGAEAGAEAVARIGPGRTTLDVDQRLVESDDAESRRDIADPVVFGAASVKDDAGGATLESRAVEVALDTEHERPCLPVVASLNAAEEAGERIRRQRQCKAGDAQGRNGAQGSHGRAADIDV